MKSFVIFFSLMASIASIAATDYCKMPCKNHRTNSPTKHIGCNHDNSFDTKNCPKNPERVQIDTPLKKLILHEHNAYRNFIAGGGDYNHSPACRMATMQWDDELAYLAGLNVLQCTMKHDACRKTKAFEYSGQNLAIVGRIPFGVFNKADQLKGAIQGWYSEVENSTQSNIDSFPSNPKEVIGHFTVMMADRNNRLGCGASTYNKHPASYMLTACNYATTNMLGFPIYKKCKSPGAECKTGRNPRYPNLCSEREVYDVNNFFE